MMDSSSAYYKQVQLLIQVLPLLFRDGIFALKGGTAINLFVRDLPRLSVDIDLVYLGNDVRKEALGTIKDCLTEIAKFISTTIHSVTIYKSFEEKSDALRLIVDRNGIKIKIELSPVLRGTVFPPENRVVSETVEDEFGFVEIPVVSIPDLYGGKICAALDRQHPRDLYDVKLLLENEGFTEDIKKATLVYIISHKRPIVELLNPQLKDIEEIFNNEFKGMTNVPIELNELLEARTEIIQLLQNSLTKNEKEFLLSFKGKAPVWKLLGLEGIGNLPAVKWKLLNLDRMKDDKYKKTYERLKLFIESL